MTVQKRIKTFKKDSAGRAGDLAMVAVAPDLAPPLGAPGVYPGLPFEEYLAGPGVSKHILATLLDWSPAHARFGETGEKPEFILGRAAHGAVLEPQAFETRYYPAPPNTCRETKAWRRAVEQTAGRQVFKAEEWDLACRVQETVYRYPVTWMERSGIQV